MLPPSILATANAPLPGFLDSRTARHPRFPFPRSPQTSPHSTSPHSCFFALQIPPVGLPKSRRFLKKPPALSRSSQSGALIPRDAKDKRYLEQLANQLDKLTQNQDVSLLLDRCAGVLLRGSLSATIRELGRLGNPERALQVCLWQEQRAYLWPDNKTLHATINVLAEAACEALAWNLLNSWAPNSAPAYDSLADGFIRCQRLDLALRVKGVAENICGPLDQGVYARLILLASRQNRREEVRVLVQELGKFPELRLNLEDCTSVMTACRKAGIYEAVQALFQWWKLSGFQPNVVMYTVVMTALANAGKHRDALAIYWEMEKSGCAPDLLAYAALIQLCSEIGDSSKALRIFARMKEAELSPTRDVYLNLIKVCCEDGRLGKANEFLDAMKKAGIANSVSLENYLDE